MTKQPNILIYDYDNMSYINGYCTSIDMSRNVETADRSLDGVTLETHGRTIFTCGVDDAKRMDNIKLDATTMRRIAKFNKEQEIRRLDAEIKSKEAKIKELDDILEDKQGRVDKIKELKKQLEELEEQNFNLREDIMIKKMAIPHEKIKDKSLYDLYDIPSYSDLSKENQELKKQLKTKHDGFMASVDEACDLAEEIQKYKEVIDKINVFLDNHDKNAGKLYYKYDNKYLLSEIKEDIRDILKEVE